MNRYLQSTERDVLYVYDPETLFFRWHNAIETGGDSGYSRDMDTEISEGRSIELTEKQFKKELIKMRLS